MKGVFINLEKRPERRKSLIERLDRSGLKAAEYLRFSAEEAKGDERELSRGLHSKGELGIWKSLIGVCECIAVRDFEDVVHVIEDDTAFSDKTASGTINISRMMLERADTQEIDIVFLDYFLDRKLFREIMESAKDLKGSEILLRNARGTYLASCSSFLIRKRSARYIGSTLTRVLRNAQPLAPVDIALRSLIRSGVINAYTTIPLLGCPSWEDEEKTSVQTEVFLERRKAQRAHILLRLLASGTKTPLWCAERLAEIYEIENPLDKSDGAEQFASFFDTVARSMPVF